MFPVSIEDSYIPQFIDRAEREKRAKGQLSVRWKQCWRVVSSLEIIVFTLEKRLNTS